MVAGGTSRARAEGVLPAGYRASLLRRREHNFQARLIHGCRPPPDLMRCAAQFGRQYRSIHPRCVVMRKRYECKPLYMAIISWFGTLGSFVVSEVFIRMVGWHGLVPIIVAALTISSMVSPVVAMIMVGRCFNANANSIKGIVFLYLGVVILCGNIDFSIMLHCSLPVPRRSLYCQLLGILSLPLMLRYYSEWPLSPYLKLCCERREANCYSPKLCHPACSRLGN